MNSCIYTGWVRHRRTRPVENSFRYRVFMMALDLSELDTVFQGRWLWSTTRIAPAWFRREDHFGDPERSLEECIRGEVAAKTGRCPEGRILLLTHLRYFGYCMNPVSFYYCYDKGDEYVETIVAEVHNVPWNERHCYVLDSRLNRAAGPRKQYRFPKDFHVSPFMQMDQMYDWRFTDPGENLTVHMESEEDGTCLFDATMVLEKRPLTAYNLRRVLIHYPLMTTKVIAAIYWQALRLWWKRCPYVPHPKAGHPARPESRSLSS